MTVDRRSQRATVALALFSAIAPWRTDNEETFEKAQRPDAGNTVGLKIVSQVDRAFRSADVAIAAMAWMPISTAPESIQRFAEHCAKKSGRQGCIEFGAMTEGDLPFVICRNNDGWQRFDRWFILPSIQDKEEVTRG